VVERSNKEAVACRSDAAKGSGLREGRAALTRTNCLFRLHQDSIKKEEIVEFLKALKAHLKQPLLVIWDGLKAHPSPLVREYPWAAWPDIFKSHFCRHMRRTSIPLNTCAPGANGIRRPTATSTI